MPKLPKKKAASVNDAESSSFPLIDDGRYPGTLKEVRVSDEPGGSGFHWWGWVYDLEDAEVDGKPYEGNAQVMNVTSLSDKAEWKLNEAFKAHGVPADTDTDELLGTKALVIVGHRTETKGARKGEIVNTVEAVHPYDGEADDDDGDEF